MKQCQITTVYSGVENAREACELIQESFLAFLRKELKTKELFAVDTVHRV